ncbi:MAG: diguanylate cyclase domain-containing protein [Bacillota bacterium]
MKDDKGEKRTKKFKNKIKRQNDQIYRLQNRYRALINNIKDAVVVWNQDYKIIDWNIYAGKLFGWNKSEVITKNLLNLLLPETERDDIEDLFSKTFNNFKNQIINKTLKKDQEVICCEWCNIPITDFSGKVIEVISIIKEKDSNVEEDQDLIYYDPLTGVYNRRYYEEELKRLDTTRQLPLSIVLGDVNRLKLTNDIFGHQHGDELLKEIADIIDSCTRSEDIIARWGGDEFGILLPQTGVEEVKKIISRIKHAALESNLKPMPPSISLGFANKKGSEEKISDIFEKAENNMYQDKEQEKLKSEERVLNNLLEFLEYKLEETNLNTDKVIELSKKMGMKLGLDEYELEKLVLLAKYHDVGKVGIPKRILNKKSTLTTEEWKQYLRHLQLGYDIAKGFSTLTPIADEILYHHESWNGTGYPQQLAGEEIPFLSRIVYITSYYYELISSGDCGIMVNVNCSSEYTKQEALEKIKEYAGSLFDPELVDVFLEICN